MARPTKYNKRIADKIVKSLSKGSTRKAAYGAANVCKDTFADWLKTYPDFAERVESAEAQSEGDVSDTLYLSATGQVDEAIPMVVKNPGYNKGERIEIVKLKRARDVRAAVEWLKRRRPGEWSEKKDIDVNVRDMSAAASLDSKLAGLAAGIAAGSVSSEPDAAGED